MVARLISTRPWLLQGCGCKVRYGEWVWVGGTGQTKQREARVGSASGSEPISRDNYTETHTFSGHMGTGRPDLHSQIRCGHRGKPEILQEEIGKETVKQRLKTTHWRSLERRRVGVIWRGTESAWSLLSEWSLAPSQLAIP